MTTESIHRSEARTARLRDDGRRTTVLVAIDRFDQWTDRADAAVSFTCHLCVSPAVTPTERYAAAA